MAKNPMIIILLIALIAVIYFFFLNNPPLDTVKVNIKGTQFNLEVAKTIPQKSLGLGKRESLCQNCGMLFTWSFPQPLTFWMKDTLIPLDIIFIDSNGKVINLVTANPEPGISDFKLTQYSSATLAQYVIELNAGSAVKLNLQPGDVIQL